MILYHSSKGDALTTVLAHELFMNKHTAIVADTQAYIDNVYIIYRIN